MLQIYCWNLAIMQKKLSIVGEKMMLFQLFYKGTVRIK